VLTVSRVTVMPNLSTYVFFPLIIANVNKCWLALYTCLACKTTLIGCAKIEEKVICPFKTSDR